MRQSGLNYYPIQWKRGTGESRDQSSRVGDPVSHSEAASLELDVCCRLQLAPSGESYGGNRRPGRK